MIAYKVVTEYARDKKMVSAFVGLKLSLPRNAIVEYKLGEKSTIPNGHGCLAAFKSYKLAKNFREKYYFTHDMKILKCRVSITRRKAELFVTVRGEEMRCSCAPEGIVYCDSITPMELI